MNKQRRQKLQAVIDRLTEQKDELEQIKDEEQEYYDNMPENLQYGEKGEKASEAIDSLDDIISTLDEVKRERLSKMIKLRIQGTPKEVERFQSYLESLPRIEVFEASGSYANRGKSQYVRVYTEVAFKQVATVNEDFEKLFEEDKQ